MTGSADRVRIALFRGINLGRAKRIPMADLRDLFEDLGYTRVRSLLASGNVVFDAPADAPGDPAARIEEALEERAGFTSRVTVLTADEIETIVADNSLAEAAEDPSRLAVGIVRDTDDLASLEEIVTQDWSPEALAVGTRAVYSWHPEGLRDSALQKAIARALGDAVTSRNWSTTLKIQAMVQDRTAST